MDCNPYLGFAASLACGYLGLKEGKMPRAECQGDAYMSADDLPTNLGDALDLLVECAPMREVLGDDFCNVYEFGETQRIQGVPAGHLALGNANICC